MFPLVTDRLVCAAGLAVYNFTSQRRRFQSLLQQSSSSLTTSRFFRLLAVSSIDMFVTVPCVIVLITTQVKTLKPSQKWSDLHYDFGQVFRYATEDLDDASSASTAVTTALSNWLPLFAAFVYFACFGMHDSALDKYAAAYCFVSEAFSKGCVQKEMAFECRQSDLSPVSRSICSRCRQDALFTPPTLGTTVASPSEQHWTERKDSKAAVEDDLPYAFEERSDVEVGDHPRGHGVLVKVERDVATSF
jgi:hypothetical protein